MTNFFMSFMRLAARKAVKYDKNRAGMRKRTFCFLIMTMWDGTFAFVVV